MILKEIFDQVRWPDVAIALVTAYPGERVFLPGYKEVFTQHKELTPESSDYELEISFAEDSLITGRFEYDAHGKIGDVTTKKCLVFLSFSEWLGMKVCEETLAAVSYERIVAVCLFEMIFFGQHSSSVETRLKMMQDLKNEHIHCYEDLMIYDMMTKTSPKDWLRSSGRWLRWSAFANAYFGKSTDWFRERFLGKTAPESYSELDRQTLKAALKDIAHRIVYAASRL